MQKISVKNLKFSKKSLEPQNVEKSALPFMFAMPVLPEPIKQNESFDKELTKISKKLAPISEKSLKTIKVPNKFIESSLPYKRRARSFSPPKDPLKIVDTQMELFPKGCPIIAIPRFYKISEDFEIKKLKEEYLKMLESAEETVITECEDTSREEI